jgi:hypothetical protein
MAWMRAFSPGERRRRAVFGFAGLAIQPTIAPLARAAKLVSGFKA